MGTLLFTYRVVVVCVHMLDDSLLGGFIGGFFGRHCDDSAGIWQDSGIENCQLSTSCGVEQESTRTAVYRRSSARSWRNERAAPAGGIWGQPTFSLAPSTTLPAYTQETTICLFVLDATPTHHAPVCTVQTSSHCMTVQPWRLYVRDGRNGKRRLLSVDGEGCRSIALD